MVVTQALVVSTRYMMVVRLHCFFSVGTYGINHLLSTFYQIHFLVRKFYGQVSIYFSQFDSILTYSRFYRMPFTPPYYKISAVNANCTLLALIALISEMFSISAN